MAGINWYASELQSFGFRALLGPIGFFHHGCAL
jgi:hypothetical protein